MDDLISRQAAMDALLEEVRLVDGYYVEDDEVINKDDAIEAIRLLPSAQPENNWVPVTKKAHPDLPIRVQVQLNNGWIITAFYQDNKWISVPDCEDTLQDEWIEAWRELPEPYKREDNGQTR